MEKQGSLLARGPGLRAGVCAVERTSVKHPEQGSLHGTA